jgi:hypothetical protein
VSLADSLSDREREQYFDEKFRTGVVLSLDCRKFLSVNYDKLALVVCVEPYPILLLINTETPKIYGQRPVFEARQLQLFAADYDFLKWDSKLDCTTPRAELTKYDIKRQVLRDMNRILGHLIPDTLKEILVQVSAAKMMEYSKKKLIIDGLRSALGY